jgi:peptidoglycan-associated lipoprotein
MSMSHFRGLSAALLALLVLAGCASTSEPEPEPAEPVQTEPAEPSPPPKVTPPPRPEVSPEGVPLDDDGQPLGTTFYFDFDRSELKPRARTILSGHARYLRENRSVRVRIEGHTDERGTREYNLALGERRATAVSEYLQSLGVRSSQLSTVSYGEERPVDPGHNESAWAKNRRAELVY